MAQEEGIALLTRLLSPLHTLITYQPLRTEVAFSSINALPLGARLYEIPPRASLDPVSVAKEVQVAFQDQSVAILIPGRCFDTTGTRHGQGGGWYDRFLSHVPREWLRIGFCYDDQLSDRPLVRKSWDQAMDYVVVINRKTANCTVYSSEGMTYD